METFFPFDLCTVSKILICFSLINRLPNNDKRFSSHLQVSILHQVAHIKFYLTISESLKKQLSKKSTRTINKRFWPTSIQGLPYMETTTLILKLVYIFINFIIPLPVNYVRHSSDVTAKDWPSFCLSKYREILDYFGKEIAEALCGKSCF